MPEAYWEDEKRGLTIYHGDARELVPMLPAESVDLVLMDPPFGHNNNNNGDLIQRWEAVFGDGVTLGAPIPIANDGPEANALFRDLLPELKRVLKPGCCCCCCCCGGGPDPQFARWSLWLGEVFDFVQMIVWDKGPMGMGLRYRRSYEVVLVGKKPGARMAWYDTTKRVENIIRPAAVGKIIPSAVQHPTQKPVELMAHFIRLHSKPGDLVLDPFCGSGTTGVASAKLGRRFIGMDCAEEWVARTAARLGGPMETAKAHLFNQKEDAPA